jgi:hypothetical protein
VISFSFGVHLYFCFNAYFNTFSPHTMGFICAMPISARNLGGLYFSST